MQKYGQLTPPSTPPPQQHYQASRRLPPTPESRIGKFLKDSLELKTILGTGAYGVVYSALDHCTGIWYAVKALSKTNANGEPLDKRQKEFQSREIELHYQASAHPNIVSMFKIVDDRDCTYVILEFCPEGDLFSNITEKGRYVSNDTSIRRAFLQILDAVEHCHRLGIYHRDLKPENILVSNAGDQVLLADFGLATRDPESDDHGCGSTFYMSPECLDQSSRRPSYRCAPNDIWSLGVVLVNLTCGRNPWKQASVEDSTYKAFTRDRNFLKTILPLSDELNDILGMIFERNPMDRITVGELKRRILQCAQFTSPPQSLPTPPQSPRFATYDAPSPASVSQGGSVFSDDSEGSLTGSCSTLSDESDSASELELDCEVDQESGNDSGYESMDQDSDPEFDVEPPKPVTSAAPREQPQAVTYSRPAAPFPQQQYALPSQEFHGYPGAIPAKQNPYFQCWAPYPQQHFARLQAGPQYYPPTPPPQHHPFYPSHNPFAAHRCWY